MIMTSTQTASSEILQIFQPVRFSCREDQWAKGLSRIVELVKETSLFKYRMCCVMECYVLSTVNDKPWCVSETVSVVRVLGTPQSLKYLNFKLNSADSVSSVPTSASPVPAKPPVSPAQSQISSWRAPDRISACFFSVLVSENKIRSENLVRTEEVLSVTKTSTFFLNFA